MIQKKYPQILISKSALLNNISIAKNACEGKLIIPVKANAYGHDAILVASVLQKSKMVDYLVVARIGEALQLREADIYLPIFTLGVELDDTTDIADALEHHVDLSVSDFENLLTIEQVAKKSEKVFNVHIKLDTGFSRLGCNPENAFKMATYIKKSENLHLVSMYTHFAMSEDNEEFTRKQLAILKQTATKLNANNVGADFYHCYNSGAVLYKIFDDDKQLQFEKDNKNLAPISDEKITFGKRPGLLTYGYAPNSDGDKLGLQPVMTLVTHVIHTNDVPAGTGVCYNHTYHTTKPCRLATIALGYGDGISRSLSGKLTVTINGRVYKQVGRITMDLIVIECDENVNVDDEVYIFGDKKLCHQDAETLASLQNTISYEITTDMAHRIPRVLVD